MCCAGVRPEQGTTLRLSERRLLFLCLSCRQQGAGEWVTAATGLAGAVPPKKKEKKEHDASIIQNPWKGVAVVAA